MHPRRLALASLGFFFASAVNAQPAQLFDETALRTIELTFKQPNFWQLLTQNYVSKAYIKADLKFLGRTYQDVGVRFRGNSSYKAVRTLKKPFKIAMDEFVPRQDLLGFRTLNLNNGFRDPTFIREVLGYWIYRKFKPASRGNLVTLVINGQNWGVYGNIEQINKDLLERWFRDTDGNRYRGERQPGARADASALAWLGAVPAAYQQGYELKTAAPSRPYVDVMQLCQTLNTIAPNRLPVELPKVLDTDNALWYLACNNVLPTVDSYIGNTSHNYYLYNDGFHRRFSLLSWDLNANFGGNAWLTVVQKQRLDPFYFATNRQKPLLLKMMAIPQWRARYLAHLRTILDEVYDWKVIGPKVTALQNLIRTAVQQDAKKLYPFAQFAQNVTRDVQINVNGRLQWIPGLKPMVDNRRIHLANHPELKLRGPALSALVQRPVAPVSSDRVQVTVQVGTGVPVAAVTLHWRVRGPFLVAPMFDDGQHGDGAPNDGVYGASIPPQPTRTRVDYYVSAAAPVAQRNAMTFLPASYTVNGRSYSVEWPKGTPSVRINEFVAVNTNGIKDQKGQFEDWIELINPLPTTVNIGGMFLTDDPDDPKKWSIPHGYSLKPGETLLVWADGDTNDGPFHAAFKLSSGGEDLALFASDGKTLLDSVGFGPQIADVATGRLLDGGSDWVTFATPSPRRSNELRGGCATRRFSALDSGKHRVELDLVGTPRLASPVTIQVRKGPPSSSVWLVVSSKGTHRALDGRIWLLAAVPFGGPLSLPTNAAGGLDLRFPIPNDGRLVGTHLTLQVFAWDTAGSQASNAVEARICR